MYDEIKSTAKHFFVYGLGKIANRLVAFILIPVYTHYLTTDQYGTLELLELTSYIVGMFLAMGISSSVLRFYFDCDNDEDRKTVVSTGFLAIWVVCIAVGLALVLLSAPASNIVFQSSDNTGLFRLVFLGLVIGLTTQTPLALIQARQKSTLYTVISVGRFALGLGLNILFIVGLGKGVEGIILSSLILQATAATFLAFYTLKWTGFRFSVRSLKQLSRYGAPFIPSSLGLFVMNFADRFLLQRFTTLSEVGIYALGYKFGMLMNPMITGPYETAVRPKMFETANRPGGKELNSHLFTYFMFIAIFFGLGVSILIKDALQILATEAYLQAYAIVPFIVLAYILNSAYVHTQAGILITKKTKYLAYIVGASAVLNLLLNFVLIPLYSVWGAAISTVASFGFMLGLNEFFAQRVYPVPYQWRRVLKLLLTAGALYAVSLVIHIEALVISILVKTAIALSFPFVLYMIRFYTSDEKRKLRQAAGEFWQAITKKFSGSNSGGHDVKGGY